MVCVRIFVTVCVFYGYLPVCLPVSVHMSLYKQIYKDMEKQEMCSLISSTFNVDQLKKHSSS